MIKKTIQIGLLVLSLLFVTCVFAQGGFRVSKISFEGLQRVSPETALTYISIKPGQALTPSRSQQTIESLYQTGFFSNVELARRGNELVVIVTERPTIGLIRFSGNKLVKKKDLEAVLKQAGIQEGLTLNRMNLLGLSQSLEQQYYTLGRYNADVTTTVKPEPRNRVAVDIKIYEGQVAKVQQIKILGAKNFTQKKLLKSFSLTTPHIWSFITKGDQFSRQKLDHDLKSLNNFYLDRGYLRFSIDSTQASITPNRRDVYVTIHVTEGPVYRLSGYALVGNTIGKRAELEKLLSNFKRGNAFSRQKVLAVRNAMKHVLASNGYALARVDVMPTVDDSKHTVYLTFNVKPSEMIYIDQINYVGNTKTNDTVLRREMRQMEGAPYNQSKIDESKRRIQNLGYLTNVQIKMEPVPGKTDKVDLQYHVKETSTATASAQAGYSDAYGFMYGANLVQNNFMGSGKTVSLGFSNNEYMHNYSFSYFNPYYTKSGISRGFSVYYQRVTPVDVGITEYKSNVIGTSMNYRFPMSEYDYLTAALGYEHLRITASKNAVSKSVFDFLKEHGNNYNEARLTLGWTHTTYDRAIFPTKGFHQTIAGVLGLPVFGNTSVDYYKLTYDAKYYQPLNRRHSFILRLSTDLGYGNGYARLGGELPFFRNFYAGGIGSVSGYDSNSLGPKDSHGNAIGGNVLTVAEAALIFPNPITQMLRTAVIFDAGNIYHNEFNPRSLRMAAGVEIDWLSPMGPLKFTLAYPLNARKGDDKDPFQFTMGASL